MPCLLPTCRRMLSGLPITSKYFGGGVPPPLEYAPEVGSGRRSVLLGRGVAGLLHGRRGEVKIWDEGVITLAIVCSRRLAVPRAVFAHSHCNLAKTTKTCEFTWLSIPTAL